MNDPTSIMKRVSRFAYTWDFQGPHVNFVLTPHGSDRLSSGDLRYLVSRLSELEATTASQKAEIERLRGLVKTAYCEGWDHSFTCESVLAHPVEAYWVISDTYAALQPKGGGVMRNNIKRLCADCIYADGKNCKREARQFSQSYETYYTDDDFCGPHKRYWAALQPKEGEQ